MQPFLVPRNENLGSQVKPCTSGETQDRLAAYHLRDKTPVSSFEVRIWITQSFAGVGRGGGGWDGHR